MHEGALSEEEGRALSEEEGEAFSEEEGRGRIHVSAGRNGGTSQVLC